MKHLHHRLTVAFLGVLTCLCSCHASDDTGRVGQELANNYNLGMSFVTDDVTASPIRSLLFDTSMLPFPPFAPSPAMAFSHWWGVDNGGTASFTDNGAHFNGTLNSISFQMWLVKANAQHDAFYALAINICYTVDGVHGACQNGITSFTAWPTWRMTGSYQNDQLKIDVYDSVNNLIPQSPAAIGWTFISGALPTHVYSPEVMFTLDTNSDRFGGCRNDILQFDSNVNNLGYYSPKTLYGTGSQADTPAYLSAPSSNTKCAMQVNHFPAQKYDQVQWHVDGL